MNELVAQKEDAYDGYNGIKSFRRPADWDARMAKFQGIMENHKGWRVAKWMAEMQEAMSSADFSVLFSDTLDREMLRKYRGLPKQMRAIVRQKKLADFRTVKRFIDSSGAQRLQQVEEKGQYKYRDKSAKSVEYAPVKYGALQGLTWEALQNDDLGFFDDISTDFAQSASNTEEANLTGLFWDSAGPIDAFFNHSDGSGQQGVSVLPLTRINLEVAIKEMMGSTAGYRSDKGDPILNVPRTLVVPPALQLTAEEILSKSVLIAAGDSGGQSANIIANRGIKLLVQPWINVLVTTGTKGNTSWGLFSETIDAGEMGLLAGHEEPEIFVRSSGAQSLNGGGTDPNSGSFDNDTVDYKVRMVMGETVLDPRGAWASDGQ